MASTESTSWLSDETFDFDIDSPTISHESGDDEVFIGPLTHKERCVAVAVTEVEKQIYHRIEEIKPEQQALLLRESTLVALKIREKDTSLTNTPRRTISMAIDTAMPIIVDIGNNMQTSEQEEQMEKEVELLEIAGGYHETPSDLSTDTDAQKIPQLQEMTPKQMPPKEIRHKKSLRRSGLPTLRKSLGKDTIVNCSDRKKPERLSLLPSSTNGARKPGRAKSRLSLLPTKTAKNSQANRKSESGKSLSAKRHTSSFLRKTPLNHEPSNLRKMTSSMDTKVQPVTTSENRQPDASATPLLKTRKFVTGTRRKLPVAHDVR